MGAWELERDKEDLSRRDTMFNNCEKSTGTARRNERLLSQARSAEVKK